MPGAILSVRTLTVQESRRLSELVRGSDDGRVVRRAQVIRLSAQGLSPSRIAQLLERSWSGVRKTINRFNREGFSSLADKPRGGRPSKVTARYVALLKEAVQASPRDMGYVFNAWTLERLREHLARRTRVILSTAYLSRLMHDHGIVYRRPKHGMTHLRDPAEYSEKKAFLEFIKKRPGNPTQVSTCSTSMSVRFTSTRR